jgi:hypothetical protein
MFGEDRRETNGHSSTVTYNSKADNEPSSGDPSIPYSLQIRHDSESGNDINISAFDDYVCAVARNTHALLVQTDAPELDDKSIDQSEFTMLKESIQRLDHAIYVTSLKLMARLSEPDKIGDQDIRRLVGIIQAKFKQTMPVEMATMVQYARNNIIPAFELVTLASDIEDMCKYNNPSIVYNPMNNAQLCTSAIFALKKRLVKNYHSTVCIVAGACLDALNALVCSILRCLPCTVGAQPGSFSKIRHMYCKHQEILGPVKQVIVCSSSPRRGCILVRTGAIGRCAGEDDLRVLMMSRKTGTDPEYFSTHADLASIKSASSVRVALTRALSAPISQTADSSTSKETADHRYVDTLHIGHAWRLPVSGRRKCHTAISRDPARIKNQNDPTLNGYKVVTLCVQWRSTCTAESFDAPWSLACVQINTCSTDRVMLSTHGKTQLNPDWGIQVLQLKM